MKTLVLVLRHSIEKCSRCSTDRLCIRHSIEKLSRCSTERLYFFQAFRDRNRSSKQFNHLSAVSEGMDALLWVGAVRLCSRMSTAFWYSAFCWTVTAWRVQVKSRQDVAQKGNWKNMRDSAPFDTNLFFSSQSPESQIFLWGTEKMEQFSTQTEFWRTSNSMYRKNWN